MPIHATAEALDFWKERLRPQQRARTLAASRFVDLPENPEDKSWRDRACRAIRDGATLPAVTSAHSEFLAALVDQGACEILAKLEARLIINAGEGVIENGGISLDRTSGLPFIPGSAVKGCARRFALHQLSEETDLESKAALLADFCEVFGSAPHEWHSGRKNESSPSKSDFWLAMVPLFDSGTEHDIRRDELWQDVAPRAATILFERLGRQVSDPEKPAHQQLPSLAGRFVFLPAFPHGKAKIEIDILTPHHRDYHDPTHPKTTAADDENPIPIPFPTIAKQTTFHFVIHPLSCSSSRHLGLATEWLTEGLQLLGLGAKTNAGYGWFSPDHEAQEIKRKHALARGLSREFAGFANWSIDERDDAILALADRREDCTIWEDTDPSGFQPICDYARQQDIDLT